MDTQSGDIRLWISLAVTCCGLAIAAWGGSSPASSGSSGDSQFALAQCMRTRGVPTYPDPIFPAGGGIERRPVPGLSRDSLAVSQAAASATS